MKESLVNLLLIKLVRISGFSSLFLAIAIFSAYFLPESAKNIATDKGQERKFSPKRKFLAGYPCGHPAKNFGQALHILEKNKHFGTDIPHGRP